MAHIMGFLDNFHLFQEEGDSRRWRLEINDNFLVKYCYGIFNQNEVVMQYACAFFNIQRFRQLCIAMRKNKPNSYSQNQTHFKSN